MIEEEIERETQRPVDKPIAVEFTDLDKSQSQDSDSEQSPEQSRQLNEEVITEQNVQEQQLSSFDMPVTSNSYDPIRSQSQESDLDQISLQQQQQQQANQLGDEAKIEQMVNEEIEREMERAVDAPMTEVDLNKSQSQSPPKLNLVNEQLISHPLQSDLGQNQSRTEMEAQPISIIQPVYPSQGVQFQQGTQNQSIIQPVYPDQPFTNFQPMAEPAVPPKDYMAVSLASLILCNFMCGGAALFFSFATRKRWQEKNYNEAAKFSRWSFILNVIAIGVGCFMWVLVLLVVISAIFGGGRKPS
jgi:hypothetical protein